MKTEKYFIFRKEINHSKTQNYSILRCPIHLRETKCKIKYLDSG